MPNMEARGPRPLTEDFESIEEAVMESPRGRWFLAEYGARLQARETRALTDQVKALESTVIANHDAIMTRIAMAIGQSAPPTPQAPAGPSPELAPRHMKYFKRDEEIFEAAPQATIAAVKPAAFPAPVAEEKHGAKLTIRRSGEASPAATVWPEMPPPAETPVVAEASVPVAEPAPSIAADPGSDEHHQRRRIVIIRHQPGEIVDVPLQDEMAKAS